MTRQALIILNPGETGAENYCQGVIKDIENFYNFLRSQKGGGWYHDEILTLTRPSKFLLDSKLKTIIDKDYTFIAFCGHGYAKNGETMLELSKGNEIQADILRSGANKRTIILDSCRKEESPLYELIEKRAISELFTNSQADSRKKFDTYVGNCSNGIVFINSCAYNETAEDLDKYGGLYNYNLIKIARDSNLSHNEYLSIVAAHNATSEIVIQKSAGNQNPEIAKSRSGPYFPFMV